MKFVIFIALSLIATVTHAQRFWVPAENFDRHTDRILEGTLSVDDFINKPVYLLGLDQQVRIKIGFDDSLKQFLDQYSVFEVCAYVANYGSAITNTIRTKHPDPTNTQSAIVRSTNYKMLCSKQDSINRSNLQTAGVKLVSPSQGVIKVRGISFRGVEPDISPMLLEDYEYSRALGYLWGDGKVANAEGKVDIKKDGILITDRDFLSFIKRNTNPLSKHFGSVAEATFDNLSSKSGRYLLQLDGITPDQFLEEGLNLSAIPDTRAFLTSVIETEGAPLVGLVADDPSRTRCNYIKALVDSLNPQCGAETCTDSSCKIPNCAFLGTAKKRGVTPGPNQSCGVYLSGKASDWRALFSSDDYHFVNTKRIPGGSEGVTQHSWESRPAYTQ